MVFILNYLFRPYKLPSYPYFWFLVGDQEKLQRCQQETMSRLRQWLKKDKAMHDPESNASKIPSNPPRSTFPDGVKVLHDYPNAAIDICFVHGLTGDGESTWTTDDGVCWPKTLLPPKLKKARILTYGYDAYVVRKSVASSNRLIDHASNLLTDLTADRANSPSRPIIFVTHSLGGLICKQAILQSRNHPDSHLRSIFDSTIGILFMGTPHKGSWMADWARIPASALGMFKSINKSLLGVLETNNQTLELIQTNFWSTIRERQKAGQPPEVTCFFEELPLPGVGQVVSKASATLEGYTSISIHGNHSNMVKFASAEENGFKTVLGELVRWTSQAGQPRSPNNPLASGDTERPLNALQYEPGSSSTCM